MKCTIEINVTLDLTIRRNVFFLVIFVISFQQFYVV